MTLPPWTSVSVQSQFPPTLKGRGFSRTGRGTGRRCVCHGLCPRHLIQTAQTRKAFDVQVGHGVPGALQLPGLKVRSGLRSKGDMTVGERGFFPPRAGRLPLSAQAAQEMVGVHGSAPMSSPRFGRS